MAEIVSVRVPAGLKHAIEEYAQNHHFLDVSEAVRSFVRKKMHDDSDPYLSEIKRLRESITHNVKQQALQQSRKQLLKELQKIDQELRGDFS